MANPIQRRYDMSKGATKMHVQLRTQRIADMGV